VNRLSEIALCCDCLIPKSALDHSPVGDDSAAASRGAASAIQPFAGTGMKLGAAQPASKQSMERQSLLGTSDDLTDRRERARMAATAR
jgi:hypothetical protein